METVTNIALFPLGAVLFPTMPMELQIFEPRYVRLLEDLADRAPEEREFGVVAIRSGHEVGEAGVRSLHQVGCTARLTSVRHESDKHHINTVGTWRFRIEDVSQGARGYLSATVSRLREDRFAAAALGDRADEVRRLLNVYAGFLGVELSTLPADPWELAYEAAAMLPTTLTKTQSLLAVTETKDRLTGLSALLKQEIRLFRTTRSLPFQPPSDQARN